MPADTINLEASSKVISKYTISLFGNISKKPLVGLGVVGTNTFTKSVFVFSMELNSIMNIFKIIGM